VLRLNSTKVTDAGLTHLEKLTGLRGLGLDGTGVTDAGIVHLVVPNEPRRLSVKKTKVTDDRVASLQALRPELRIERCAESLQADRV